MQAVDVAVRGTDLVVILEALGAHHESLRCQADSLRPDGASARQLHHEMIVAERLISGLHEALAARDLSTQEAVVPHVC